MLIEHCSHPSHPTPRSENALTAVAENPKTIVVILDTGDEILAALKSVAGTKHLAASSFKAIGALSAVELGWFNWATKKYETAVNLQEQVALLSLIETSLLKTVNRRSTPI